MAELSAATLVYKIKAVEQDIQNSKKRRDRLEALEAAGEAFDPRRLTAVQSELSALQSLLNCLMEKQVPHLRTPWTRGPALPVNSMSFGEALEQSKMRREEDEKKDREVAAAKKLTKNQAAEKSKTLKEGGFMRFMSRNDPDKAQFDDLLSPLLKETREF